MRRGPVPNIPSIPTLPLLGVVGFDPSSISGLALWFKADLITGVSDGGAVASWPDLSGNGRNATQGTGSNQPLLIFNQINGKKVVRFDGTDDNLVPPNISPASQTMFVVTKCVTATTVAYGTIFATGASRLCAALSTATWGTFTGADLSAGEALVASFNILEMKSGPSLCELYRNGLLKVSGGAASTGAGTCIGSEVGSFRPVAADIAEIILYDSVLSATDRSSVEKYLGQSYGITI